ncbi:restriction endonuclease subunit S [Mycoplasmopsis felis]|uniref:restriction endonuclease subunit S n=2 Tax=Mycoplasmopsis felis TaxID=33923 RepID=UPI002F91658B
MKEERLLNFIEYKNGRAHENFVSKHGEYILVNSKFISSEGMSIKKFLKTSQYYQKNTITLVLSDIPNGKALAKTFIIPKDNTYALNQRIAGLTIKKGIDLHFINKTINRNPYFLRLDDGINQTNLNINQIKNMRFYTTDISEQQKIGKLLDQISNLITLEQSKLNKLKQLKQTLLQKCSQMVIQKVPRIRFEGFEGEWEEEKLEEIGQTYTGLSGKTKKIFGHGNSRYITYLNIFNNPIANLKGLDRIEEDRKQNSVKYGDIFVTTSSEIPEEVGITSIWPFKDKENIYLNSFCFGIRLNNINNYYINFLAYNLRNNELRKDIVLLAQGISRFNISNRRFMKLNILLPNISEQQKIGDFFSNIDTLINLYNSKLNKLKQIKEGLLQKMFV